MSSTEVSPLPTAGPDTPDISPYAMKYRMWWLLPTAALSGLGEIAGWSGRLWSSYNIDGSGFTIQITATIIAPTPLLAANFIILSRMIVILGSQYSFLSARLYGRIFLTCDIIALVVQAAGGMLASAADTDELTRIGGYIALGGVGFQLVVVTVFALLAGIYFLRAVHDRPTRAKDIEDAEKERSDATNQTSSPSVSGLETLTWASSSTMLKRMKWGITGLGFSTSVLIIRGIYRSIELAGGWRGPIIETQVYFNVFDATMVIFAMYSLNVVHPGRYLRA